jgi:hypothetical protein
MAAWLELTKRFVRLLLLFVNICTLAVVNGIPRSKYSHDTSPSSIEADIQAALQEAQSKQEL